MKVLSGNIATKTLTGGGMEQLIEFRLDGNANISTLAKELNEEKLTQSIDSKWNLVRRLKKGHSFIKTRGSDSDAKKQLFGQPLYRICPDHASLPKSVTEILVLLRKNGPSTEGVFRKQCNSKNMKDIREQLNNDMEVDLEGQPVVLLVGLLKSFLKELPGSLLVAEFYDKWMTALESKDAQQRALEIRNVVDELPGPNKLLLQHLVCVLHHIQESADINKMDASNLALCIGPTLLQLDATPLDEQPEKMKKVTDLTQFLIEHWELLGENIPTLLDTDKDSLSSQHHDSAYDSTDPDGDGDIGESTDSAQRDCDFSSSSSSSLSPSTNTSSWPSDAAFLTKSPFNRRCSEPIIVLSANLKGLCSHARSHDDCSVERQDYEEQPLKKQISDDSFLLRGKGGARPVVGFPKPSSNMEIYTAGVKGCSCSSLESATSNQSESSVFTSSPQGSPTCSRRPNQPAPVVKPQPDIPTPISDEKRRSQSMRVTNKVLMRTRSLGAFSRSSLKKGDAQKENSFPCETLQEDSQSETDTSSELLPKPRPLSAITLPCRPPSYEQAVQNVGPPPLYGSMTVHDAIQLERRSRPSSVNYDCPVNQYVDCFGADRVNGVQRRQPFRQRAMSESVSAGRHEAVSRRCSQPVFEEFSYAKESYV